jgi:ribosomal protein S18 acetylase RimI-like enzyme
MSAVDRGAGTISTDLEASARIPAQGSSAGAEAVRRALPTEADAVAQALGAAFVDDPVFRWTTPDDTLRAESNRIFFAEVVDALSPHDDAWTLDGVPGAALWVPAGKEAMSAERGEIFTARLADLPGADMERMAALIALLGSNHPAEPHEYLWFLGVAPATQGRGIGGRLLKPVLQRADQAGAPAYLEATSERNKALYERHGFVAAEPLRTADSPPLWPMWREPR